MKGTPNGLRFPRVGGRGLCVGAGGAKTRSHALRNAQKCDRIPPVGLSAWLAVRFEFLEEEQFGVPVIQIMYNTTRFI